MSFEFISSHLYSLRPKLCNTKFASNLQEDPSPYTFIVKVVLAMTVFVSVLALVYSIIFHWSPMSALYFVTMTTFANGNIGDLVPEVIFYLVLCALFSDVTRNPAFKILV